MRWLRRALITFGSHKIHSASFRRSGIICFADSGNGAESMVEAMAEGDAKIMAQKEISLAQDAMLSGKMGVCASHLGKAMHAGMAK